MNSTQNGVPSEKSKAILKALRETVAEELEKKRKLGQYMVIWDRKKPVQVGADAPISKS
jgi:hypothetical protein